MPRRTVTDADLRGELMALLGAARRLMGVRVSFRDYLDLAGLEDRWRWRLDEACAAVKTMPGGLAGCVAFCARQVVREVSTQPGGRLLTCPFGHTEAVVPVVVDGQCYGQVVAGPLWTGTGAPPRPGLSPADTQRAADVLTLSGALALRCGELIARHLARRGQDRRDRIARWVQRHHHRDATLGELAAELKLSVSRCGHLVRQLTNRTFPELIREARLAQAARLLQSGDEPVRRIAAQVGFTDAGYFNRVFRRAFGTSPQVFRVRQTPGMRQG
jgi:AraC-like DNA-binding protein